MQSCITKVAQAIALFAQKEDRELREISNEGIFHMPELAFSYACGKSIMQNHKQIFDGRKANWVREKDLGNGGPTDLLFEFECGHRIAIEFKMRDKSSSYLKDLKKLSLLKDDRTARIFCALTDTFNRQLPDDGRHAAVEKFEEIPINSLLEPKPSFQTNQNWYSGTVSCVVGVWSVGNVPTLPS